MFCVELWHGDDPDLENLNRGDLVHTTDFRRVYTAILRDWMGADSKAILGRRFEKTPVILPTDPNDPENVDDPDDTSTDGNGNPSTGIKAWDLF